MTSTVAVIVVNYNGGDFLRQCLDAVARQTLRPTRVIVIDNGSSDDSLTGCGQSGDDVEIHRMHANLGFARANNLAVAMAPECEWIALINPDAFAEADWLEQLAGAAQRYPSYDVFASRMVSARDPTVLDGAGDAYQTDGRAWPRYQGAPVGVEGTQPQEVFAASGGAAFLRRAAFLEVGGFDERYFCYHEDVDLGFRLRLNAYRCLYVPQAMVRHVGSAIAGKGSEFSIYHVHRNIVWTFLKNMPGRYLWQFLPSHLAVNLMSTLWFVIKGQGQIVLRAKWDALRGLPWVLAERRRLQHMRRVDAAELVRAMQRGGVLRSLVRRTLAALSRPFR